MAAKLCLECGGSGKVAIPSIEPVGEVPFVIPYTLLQCEKCKGLGYISIPK